jgi:dihydrofolate synthase/folylpolyglutamate synthase
MVLGASHAGLSSIRTLEQAAAFLEGLLDVERRPDVPYSRLGLDAIRQLLARLGDPQRGLSVVHVAGSKGKGSIALLAEHVLRARGERVGTFTSPHLESWTERFRLDGRPVAEERLAQAVERVRPHVEELRQNDPAHAPTFFDATTAAALLLFREARVERAILEVGLGGRLDSTNVVDPAVSCIASVELEHTDRLGTTLAEIAWEKAGVIKPKRPVVVGALPAEAQAPVLERAAALEAPLVQLGRDFSVDVVREGLDGLELRFRDGDLRPTAHLPLLGRHQAHNAALAVACTKRLEASATIPLQEAVARGLAVARLPARIEVLAREPWIVVDAAHTAVSARALAGVLERIPRRRTRLVLSISAGKDLGAILEALLPQADEVTVTRAEPRRSLAPQEIAAAVQRTATGLALNAVPNPFLAVRGARESLAKDELLCVAGSVYLAGIARRLLL